MTLITGTWQERRHLTLISNDTDHWYMAWAPTPDTDRWQLILITEHDTDHCYWYLALITYIWHWSPIYDTLVPDSLWNWSLISDMLIDAWHWSLNMTLISVNAGTWPWCLHGYDHWTGHWLTTTPDTDHKPRHWPLSHDNDQWTWHKETCMEKSCTFSLCVCLCLYSPTPFSFLAWKISIDCFCFFLHYL